MAQQLTFLEYTFLFDSADAPYSNRFQFDADLASFFNERGMDSQLIKAVDGGQGRMIIYIQKKEMKSQLATTPETTKVATPGSQLKSMTKTRGYDGKFH